MKTIIPFIFGTLLLIGTSINANAQTNLLVNGSFETLTATGKPATWTLYNNANILISTTEFHEGTKSLQLVTNGSIEQVAPGILESDSYTFSFWYKYIVVPANATQRINYASSWWGAEEWSEIPPVDGESELMTGNAPAVPNVWLPLTVTLTAPEGAMQFWLTMATAANVTSVIDDVKLYNNNLSIDDKQLETINIYTEGNTAYIATEGGEQIAIYNLVGQKVAESIGQYKVTVMPNLPKEQMLIVRLDQRSAKILSK